MVVVDVNRGCDWTEIVKSASMLNKLFLFVLSIILSIVCFFLSIVLSFVIYCMFVYSIVPISVLHPALPTALTHLRRMPWSRRRRRADWTEARRGPAAPH